GNFYTLRDLLAKGLDPRAIRYFLLTSHYRKQLNFTIEGVSQASQALQRLDDFSGRVEEASRQPSGAAVAQPRGDLIAQVTRQRELFDEALDDDLNTAEALGALFDLVRIVNAGLDRGEADSPALAATLDFLEAFRRVFGVSRKGDEALPGDIASL